MLFNPNWEHETKADPFTLSALIAWLEKMPKGRRYDFSCQDGSCLLDQYISSVTGKLSAPSTLHWTVCGGYVEYDTVAYDRPWTFGAALKRARDLQARSGG